MNKKNISGTNEVLYEETLDNGLKVFIYKMKGFQKKYACFQTKYGSINNEFVPIGEKDMKKFPLGIAHFLEHKLFESEEEDTFKAFENNGAYVNAATSFDKTYYYFTCTDKFDDNLKILLDFVQKPYLTDENVEKEKGIIAQEIDMCDDDPDRFLCQKLYENVMSETAYQYDIAGTKESIYKITKEDLLACYNTFYHPSNMFLTIIGDVDVEKTIALIKENQSNKKFAKQEEIIQKKQEEPKQVKKENETFIHNVENKKIGYAYKIILPSMKDEDNIKFKQYISIYFDTLFGLTSDFKDKLIKDKIVKSYFSYDYDFLKFNVLLIFFDADVLDEKELENRILNKLKDKKNLRELFDIKRRNILANYIRTFDSSTRIGHYIRNLYSNYGKLYYNLKDIYESLNYEDYIKNLDLLYFNNVSRVILNKK